MKIGVRGISTLVIFVLLSCSKDDDFDTDVPKEPEINITLVGEDTERVYQYTYNSSVEAGEQFDLTEELGVDNSYLTLRQEGHVLSFYTFASGNFSLAQKNVETGANAFEANFYTENDQKNILWGTNDEKNIYLGFFAQGTSDFGLLTITMGSGIRTELNIEDGIQTSYQPIYHQGKLLLTYKDRSNNYKLAVIDSNTNKVIELLEFGALVPNIFIDDKGDVVILKSNRGENYRYTIYNSNNFEPGNEFEFSLTRYFDPGILTAKLIGQELFYYGLYVQPAEVKFGPASFNLSTNVETLVDMERIVNAVESERKIGIRLISQGFDRDSGSYLVGYANLTDSNTLEGGMLVVSFEGKLLRHIPLPFVPTYFLTK